VLAVERDARRYDATLGIDEEQVLVAGFKLVPDLLEKKT